MSDDVVKEIGEHEAEILSHALPYMQNYAGRIVVIKYGGHAMGDEALGKAFCQDVALLKQSGVHPVVVHGGGPQIGSMLERMDIKSEFRDGLRVTDKQTIEVVEMVLAGSINKQIVASINNEGARAVGLCGKDGNMVLAEKLRRTSIDPNSNIERIVDLGFVGEPKEVDSTVLDLVVEAGLIPVVAPVCFGADGKTYNVNADTFAGALAQALDAKRLLFLTDVEGVLDNDKNLIKELSVDEARKLISDGTINGGMIPKVETCIDALGMGKEELKNGVVEGVVIVNGKKSHAVLLELFTEHGAGTFIKR